MANGPKFENGAVRPAKNLWGPEPFPYRETDPIAFLTPSRILP